MSHFITLLGNALYYIIEKFLHFQCKNLSADLCYIIGVITLSGVTRCVLCLCAVVDLIRGRWKGRGCASSILFVLVFYVCDTHLTYSRGGGALL